MTGWCRWFLPRPLAPNAEKGLLSSRAASLPTRSRRCLVCAWFGLALAVGTPALAEDPPRRVGSLDYVSGPVAYALRAEAADTAEPIWLQADFNQPVCEDMAVQTGPLGRARVRIGSSAIEIASDTVLDVLNLSDRLVEASIRQGRIHMQLRDLAEGESVEIEVPGGSFWLLKPGTYDIDAGSEARPARIAVFEGKARFAAGPTDLAIEKGEEALITGSYPAVATTGRIPPGSAPAPANPDAAAGDAEPALAGAQDDFLQWAVASEYNPEQPQSARYVSSEMTGQRQLDAYGRWENSDDYGPVWYPASVPADWAPYRFGHWTSIKPWGWTWIDDQPWGFAPFHFGRWVQSGNRWGWAPGRRVKHPVYAPALVAFVETSEPSGGPQAADPPVGWFPLAPGEAYSPWYQAGRDYVESVNVIYPVLLRERVGRAGGEPADRAWQGDFANRRFATLVHRDAFAYGRPVGREMLHVPTDRLERAVVMTSAPRIMPSAMRTVAGPVGMHMPYGATPVTAGLGALRGAPREAHPGVAGPGGGLHGEPHGPVPAMAGPGALRAGQREPVARMTGPPGLRGEPHGAARAAPHEVGPGPPAARTAAGPLAHPSAMPAERGVPRSAQHYGRPEISHVPTPASPAAAPQFGRPEIAHTPQQFRQPGVAPTPGPVGQGTAPRQFGRPEVGQTPGAVAHGAAQQMGRPEAFHTPTPSYHGTAQQFGRPEVSRMPAAMSRAGGPQQIMHAGAPAAIGRGGAARAAPQVAARPAPTHSGGSGAAQHKK